MRWRPAKPVAPVMTANSDYLFVLRGGVLYQYDAKDLRLLKQVRLPEPEPRRPGPPPPGAPPPPAPPFGD